MLLIESTYGDRRHEDADAVEQFADAIRRTVARGGIVLIPAFAVDRTEVLLVRTRRGCAPRGGSPTLPVVVDSPMALACLRVYRKAHEQHWPELRTDLRRRGPLRPGQAHRGAHGGGVGAWNDPRTPVIIISASGMAAGGRVLHHLKHMLANHRHTIAIVGFAAAGTRARQLLDGARAIKIHGRYVPVHADVLSLDAFSAHADMDELYAWATAAAGAVGLLRRARGAGGIGGIRGSAADRGRLAGDRAHRRRARPHLTPGKDRPITARTRLGRRAAAPAAGR